MRLDEFDYDLPGELIAQHPLPERDASRLMVLDRATQTIEDRVFRDLPQILEAGDLLVFNNTKVFPARLLGRRKGITAQKIGKRNPAHHEFLNAEIEVLLTGQESEDEWQALGRPRRQARPGGGATFGGGEPESEVLGAGASG